MSFKQIAGIAWKCCNWLFLLSLPFTAIPLICGIINGTWYSIWNNNRIAINTDAWLYEVKDLSEDWGIPGNTFRDYEDRANDFQLLRLNFNDWASKLGFIQPLEYSEDESKSTPINKYADLETLMVDTSPRCGPPPSKEQWVYVSDWAWPSVYEWDAAFDAATQAAYVPSALNNSRLFFIKCRESASFLCGVWGVRAPTLLHFSYEDSAPSPEDIVPGLTYSGDISYLRAVTARVIEFPLENSYTGLPSFVFPGPKEQILAIMRGDKLYEQFDPWNDFEQSLRRFQEYVADNFYQRKGTFLYYLEKSDDWVTKHLTTPVGLEGVAQFMYHFSLIVFAALTNLTLQPWLLVKQLFLDFFGYPKRGDQILGEINDGDDDFLMGFLNPFGFGQDLEDLWQPDVKKDMPGGKFRLTSPAQGLSSTGSFASASASSATVTSI